MKRGLSAIACLAYIAISAGCRQSGPAHTLSPSDFTRSRNSIESFFQAGAIEKIIVPEITENSLIAEVDQIVVNKDEEIYLANLDSQNAVWRFDQRGKFITKYGRLGQGPGEYSALMAFDLDDKGRVCFLTDNKIIIYNQLGELEKETRLYGLGGDIKSVGDEIYARIYDTSRDPERGDFIFRVYDRQLAFQRGLFRNDPRLKAYRLLPRSSVALLEKKIIFTDVYDLALNILDPESDECRRIVFPNENAKIASVWKKDHLSEEDRSSIRGNIHRFNAIYSFGRTIYLTEIIREKNEVNFWLMDLDRKRIEIYPLLELIGNEKKPTGAIRFDNIIGAYKNGLIFIVDDERKFEIIKQKFPEYKDRRFGVNDNPMLVFFRVNQRK